MPKWWEYGVGYGGAIFTLGASTKVVSNSKEAEAQQGAADEAQARTDREANIQREAARLQREYVMGISNEAAQAAEPSAQELQSLDQQLKLYERTLALQGAAVAREEQLLDAVDPALKEA